VSGGVSMITPGRVEAAGEGPRADALVAAGVVLRDLRRLR
jgi:hypothetical protein